MNSLRRFSLALFAVALPTVPASAQSTYVIAGPTDSVMLSAQSYAWNRELMAPLRAALETSSNFGPAGAIETRVQTRNLDALTTATLQNVDALVMPFVDSEDLSRAMIDAVVEFYLRGGDLLLLCDDGRHDAIARELGIPVNAPSSERTARGRAPFFRGRFGSAPSIDLLGLVGRLDPVAVTNHGGRGAALTPTGEMVVARWNEGDYAPRAGAMVLCTDTDALTSAAASYSSLNNNGVFGLNLAAMLVQREPVAVIGGPDALWTTGSTDWAWDGGSYIDGFRDALENPNYFGKGGLSPVRIHTEDLVDLSVAELSLLDGFVTTYWREAAMPSGTSANLAAAFHQGLNLFIFGDSPSTDGGVADLGLQIDTGFDPDNAIAARPTNDGPFGALVSVQTFGSKGHLDPIDVHNLGGSSIALTAELLLASYFPPESYADGTGAMVLCSDTDVLAETRADYTTLNPNARFALNSIDYALRDRVLRVGGPSAAFSSGDWSWTGSHLAAFRGALEDRTEFGPGGYGGNTLLYQTVKTVDVDRLDAATLAKLDVFVTGFWADASMSDANRDRILDYFRLGGNLWTLQDDPTHDRLGEALGVPTWISSPTVCTGSAPLFDGPAGWVTSVERFGNAGYFLPRDIDATRATVAATDTLGDAAALRWEPGQYGLGAGALLAFSDTDLLADTVAEYGSVPNENGKFALNAVCWLLTSECQASVIHYGMGCPDSDGLVPTIALDGCPSSGRDVRLRIANARGGSPGFLFVGLSGRDSVSLGGCELLVAAPNIFGFTLGGPTGVPGEGSLSLPATLPDGIGGLLLNLQAFTLAPKGVGSTEGIEFFVD